MFVAPPGTRFLRHVGVGSTFEVAIVEQGGTERIAKRVRAGFRDDPVAQGALDREACALACLPAGLAPTLIERGDDTSGGFVLEEHIPGASLRDLEASLPPRALGALARSAVTLLTRAHAATDAQGPLGYVHGDPSPDHFVLDASGALRLIDHGASRCRAHPEPSPGRGTLPFVAPELVRGETSPTAATDRYATAVLVAELVTGRRLVRAHDHAAMLLEIGERGHDLTGLGALPDALGRALAASLAPDPAARPATLDALADPALYDALDAAIRP